MSEEKILREVFIPVRIVKRGAVKSKIIHKVGSQKELNRPLLRALAKAYRWENGIKDFGRADWYINKNKLSKTYVRRILNLNNLSPKIKKAIIDGEFPRDILLQDLILSEVSLLWSEQEQKLLGEGEK